MIIEILGFDNYIFSEKYYTLPLMFYVPQSNYANIYDYFEYFLLIA